MQGSYSKYVQLESYISLIIQLWKITLLISLKCKWASTKTRKNKTRRTILQQENLVVTVSNPINGAVAVLFEAFKIPVFAVNGIFPSNLTL